MTEQEVFLRIHEISESDAEMLRQLAAEISWECRTPSRVVLDSWVSSPQSLGIPCATVCTELKELAVGEMLQRAGAVEPDFGCSSCKSSWRSNWHFENSC